MTAPTRSGDGPDGRDGASWATETLPLSVRRELLERELNKLGLRKHGAAAHEAVSTQQQQPQREATAHPQAGDSASHGD
jgi:hypothetical protein